MAAHDERLDRLERLFRAASLHPPEERESFLRAACGDDRPLMAEVMSLLEADEQAEADGFLAGSPVHDPDAWPERLEGVGMTGAMAAGGSETAASTPRQPPEVDLTGESIGRYRIVEQLGGGGMGLVYRAFDERLGRQVALKFLHTPLRDVTSARRRFEKEARAASALNHPNICTIYDIGQSEDGALFLAMALYEGQTLKDRLEAGPLSPDEAMRIAGQVADGLAAAHRAGIVHRDVKPANVQLAADGRAVLLDFGIAKLVEGDDVTQTQSGAFGTVAYMAPEQVRGEEITPAADFWALGVSLFEMLSGARPFEGPGPQAVLYAIANEEPSFQPLVDRDTPEELIALIRRLLSKRPSERSEVLRFGAEPSTQRLRSASTSALPAPGLTARLRPEWLSKRGSRVGVLAVVLVAVLATLAVWTRDDAGGSGAGPTRESRIAVLPFVVRGSLELAFLGDGIVDLLSTKLDGVTGLQPVDPRAVLSAVPEGRAVMSPAEARRLSRSLDADLYIAGSITQVGQTVQIDARLFEAEGEAGELSFHSESGSADELFGLIDRLAADLITEQVGASRARIARLASVTTGSLPALKAYLEGEAHLRGARFVDAEQAFRRAVQIDSTFALAWFRIGVVADWLIRPDVASEAAGHVSRSIGQLSDRDRQLFEAFDHQQKGRLEEAIDRYQSIIGLYADDIESWVQLGELLFHYRTTQGFPLTAAREPWQNVLRFEPENTAAITHLVRLELVTGDKAAADSLIDRALALAPEGDRSAEMLVLRAHLQADETTYAETLSDLRIVSDDLITEAAWAAAAFTDNPEWSIRVAELMTDPVRAGETRGLGHIWIAHLQLWRGQLDAAWASLDRAADFLPDRALEQQTMLALYPFAPTDRARLAVYEARLDGRVKTPVSDALSRTVWFSANNGLHEHIRTYLRGRAALERGSGSDARSLADRLAALPAPPITASFPEDLSLSLRAHVLAQSDRESEALALLEAAPRVYHYNLPVGSMFIAFTHERWLLARLLDELGRSSDALRWYEAFDRNSVFDAGFRAPARFYRAELLARLGRAEEARADYEAFLRMWSDSDDVFQPMKLVARAGLAALDGEMEAP